MLQHFLLNIGVGFGTKTKRLVPTVVSN